MVELEPRPTSRSPRAVDPPHQRLALVQEPGVALDAHVLESIADEQRAAEGRRWPEHDREPVNRDILGDALEDPSSACSHATSTTPSLSSSTRSRRARMRWARSAAAGESVGATIARLLVRRSIVSSVHVRGLNVFTRFLSRRLPVLHSRGR